MNHRWFNGPEFLYEEEDAWPQRKRVKHEDRSDDCLAEIAKPKITFATDASQPWMDPLRYFSWARLTRVTAWVIRFGAN